MATLSPPSAKQPTTVEQREEELQKWRFEFICFGHLFISGLLIYYLRDDWVSVATIALTYGVIVLGCGRRFGCWEPTTDGGRWWLNAFMWSLFLSLAVLLVTLLARRTTPPSVSSSARMLLVAAGTVALAGGVSGYLLHRYRRTCSKQQRQEVIPLTA